MAIEQAALTDAVIAARRREEQAADSGSVSDSASRPGAGAGHVAVLYGWYNTVGYIAQAVGALTSGVAVEYMQRPPLSLSPVQAYRTVFFAYAVIGGLMALAYTALSPAAEAVRMPMPTPSEAPSSSTSKRTRGCSCLLPRLSLGLRRPATKYIVARLSALFATDAFAGAFVMQAFVAFWFNQRWGFSSDLIGYLLMASNVVAGLSGVAAAYLIKRWGAMLTMVATHLPSNVLLLSVPAMPTPLSAAALLVARFSLSQMDVPARQAYVVMVVASDERSAAGGITNIVRSLGMAGAPLLLGRLSDVRGAAARRLGLRRAVVHCWRREGSV
jgi:predicted MFS family arabinose efflux permease